MKTSATLATLLLLSAIGAGCGQPDTLPVPMVGEDDDRLWASPAWAEAFTEAVLKETVRVFGGDPPMVPPKWPGVAFYVSLDPHLGHLAPVLEPGLKRVEGYGGLLSNAPPPGWWVGNSYYDNPKGPWIVSFISPVRADETGVAVRVSVLFGSRGQQLGLEVAGHPVGDGEWNVESVGVVSGKGRARYPVEHDLPRETRLPWPTEPGS